MHKEHSQSLNGFLPVVQGKYASLGLIFVIWRRD